MGLLSFFKRKPKEEVTETEDVADKQEVTPKRNCEHDCEICNKQIGADRYKKLQGHWFHKKCFKKKQKEAFNGKL